MGSVCDVIVTMGPGSGSPCSSAKLQALGSGKPVACLGPVAGGRAGVRDAAIADLLIVDVAELSGAALFEREGGDVSEETKQRAKLTIEPALLEHWVETGTLPGGDAASNSLYEPGAIKEMATAALEDMKKMRAASKDKTTAAEAGAGAV